MTAASSKAFMGAALVLVVTLALVLALVFLLLAELYCSLLLRTRGTHRKRAPTPPTSAAAELSQQPYTPSLCSFYYQGVLPAPRSFLFPATDFQKQPNSPTFTHPHPFEQRYSASSSSTATDDHLVYICNPIYDAMTAINPKVDTPFETPGTSPSRLEATDGEGSSSSSGRDTTTPPLTPMQKLPAEGPSVSLRSICTTGSDSNNSINCGVVSVSSSSSDSEKDSPSW